MDSKIVYCHFSFRRPRDKVYGIFAVAIYGDAEGKQLLAERTLALTLWEDHQHITAIQSYSNALENIWRWQARMMKYNVSTVMLVTNNSTLAGWILDHNKNKNYTHWMRKATYPYRVGAKKEISLGVGLCEAVKAEKSHKFCREDLICNRRPTERQRGYSESRLDVGGKFNSILDIIKEDVPDGLDDLIEN